MGQGFVYVFFNFNLFLTLCFYRLATRASVDFNGEKTLQQKKQANYIKHKQGFTVHSYTMNYILWHVFDVIAETVKMHRMNSLKI